jgi:hypothetical protein
VNDRLVVEGHHPRRMNLVPDPIVVGDGDLIETVLLRCLVGSVAVKEASQVEGDRTRVGVDGESEPNPIRERTRPRRTTRP